MGCKGVNSWTLAGLVSAFLDLSIAYFMLCISAFVFLPSKVLSFFEPFIPCPCSGFFGYQNSHLCLKKLLFHWPVRKIYSVMDLVKSRLPFDEILFEDQTCGKVSEGFRDRKYGNGEAELDGEGCSSAFSSQTLHNSVDREGGFDSKGKKVVSQKQKSAARRRKRASLYYGKAAPFLPSNLTSSVEVGVPQPSLDGSEMRSEVGTRFEALNGVEDDLQDWWGKEINGDSSSVDKFTCNPENRTDNVANDSDTIRMLERLLEEEKSARVALYRELEEERAAAASAADEALAMILRLQEDKGAVEMEAKQYSRMIDEKFAYDEEEMSILKEILVRRETEIHFLEKEVKAYREMNFSDNDLLVDDLESEVKSNEQRPSLSICSDVKAAPMTQHSVNSETICEKEAPKAENYSSGYEGERNPVFEEETSGKHSELVSELSTSKESTNLAENEKELKDIGLMFEAGETKQNFVEELEKCEERLTEADDKSNSSVTDLESTVYDVHVIDEKTIIWKEDAKTREPTGTDTSGSDSPGASTEEIQGNLQCTALTTDRPSSSSPVEYERAKIDSEIEWLREKLRIVQEEKEKFTFTGDRRERENIRLQLVEEIVKQLKEIQQLRQPTRHASLPPLSSEKSLKKRRSRSMALEGSDST